MTQDPASSGPRTAFDGALRRRIFLFRHGDVNYIQPNGERVRDSRGVDLTAKGRAEAEAMAAYLADFPIDRAVISGLPRTRQTAERLLAGRGLELHERPGLEEIRSAHNLAAHQGGTAPAPAPEDLIAGAYALTGADKPGARYRGGELFTDFTDRVLRTMSELLSDLTWRSMVIVAHGGTNRAVLGWATGAALKAFEAFEQDTCCLNVIDIDQDTAQEEKEPLPPRRMIVRAVNITADDPAKHDRHYTTLEDHAHRLREMRNAG